jgi:tetratricopeptide (TPR) repeat protein
MPEIEERPSLASAIEDGLRHQAGGRLLEAAECYRRAYTADPSDADALLLLGIVARQTGQWAAAIRLISLAAERKPHAAHIHLNLALAHLAAGDLDRARSSCQQSLALDPHNGRTWCCMGEIETKRANVSAALAAYTRALGLPTGAEKAALALGNQLCREQRYPEALAIYARGLRSAPASADLLFASGAAAAAGKRPREAKAAYLKALRIRPKFPKVLLNLGNLLYDEGDFRAGAACYARAIALRPEYGKAFCNLGNALSAMGHYAQAIGCYERALARDPEATSARHNLGNALLHRRDYRRAEACFRQVLALEPASAEHHNSLGNALLQQRRTGEAENHYSQALALKPDYAAAHINLANTLLQLGQNERMNHHYRRGVELDSACPGGQYNLGLACLREGNYREGWQRHEARWEFRELNLPRRSFTQPQWRGKPLEGRTILLHAEQGLGDTLQFVRYVPLVAQRGGRVILEVQPRLRPLLDTIGGVASVLTRGDPLPEFATHCPLMSLPLAFDTTVETIPASIPYIRPHVEAIASAWQKFSPQNDKFRIGLCWAGNPRHKGDHQRSTTLETFAALAEVGNAVFFSLQFGPSASRIAPMQRRFPVIDACSQNKSLAETAALMATLNLILSVDTSIAHLAGAMGLPVWIMLPHLADWRWLEQRRDSPWYPTARLFRQPAPDGWSSLIEEVRAALSELTSRRGWQPSGDSCHT